MKMIVGLGNPGDTYQMTRHNTGFMVIDRIADKLQVNVSQHAFQALIAITTVKGEKVLLMKPLTYMNLSGNAVAEAAHFYRIEPSDICIIYDDMDLPCGTLRLRTKGSAGGHNGMKSIISCLHTQEFPRIRLGIDKHPYADTVDYVIGRFTKEQFALMTPALDTAADAALLWMSRSFVDVMNQYNRKTI